MISAALSLPYPTVPGLPLYLLSQSFKTKKPHSSLENQHV